MDTVGDSWIQPDIASGRQKNDEWSRSRFLLTNRRGSGFFRIVPAATLFAGFLASVLGFATEPCNPRYLQEVVQGLRPSPRVEAGLGQGLGTSSPVVAPPIGSYAVLITHPGETLVGTVEEVHADGAFGIRQGREPIRIVRPQEVQRLPVIGTVGSSGQIRLRIDDGREIAVDRERRPVTIYTQTGEQQALIRAIIRNYRGQLQIRAEIESGPEQGVNRDLAVEELFPPRAPRPAIRPNEVVAIPQTRNRDLPTTRQGAPEGELPPTRPGNVGGEPPASEENRSPVFLLTRVARGRGGVAPAVPLPETLRAGPPEPIAVSPSSAQAAGIGGGATQPWIPVGPAVFIAPAFRVAGQIRLVRCCEVVISGRAHQIRYPLQHDQHRYRPVASQPATDLYLAGESQNTLQMRTRPGLVQGVEYSRPDHLVGAVVPDVTIKVSHQIVEERLAFEEQQAGRVANETATFAGSGSQAAVYFLHPPVPVSVREQIQTALSNGTRGAAEAIRRGWAQANSRLVMKIRNMNPWNEGPNTAAQMIRRDLALQGLAVQLTAGFRFRGEALIRVATHSGTPEQLSRGILFQEAVDGPSAYDLQQAVNRILAVRLHGAVASLSVAEQSALTQSHELLRQARLSVDEAQARLKALEHFYRETYTDVINFSVQNGLQLVGNYDASGVKRLVGFDFLHGRNVFWDRATQKFVMIDW